MQLTRSERQAQGRHNKYMDHRTRHSNYINKSAQRTPIKAHVSSVKKASYARPPAPPMQQLASKTLNKAKPSKNRSLLRMLINRAYGSTMSRMRKSEKRRATTVDICEGYFSRGRRKSFQSEEYVCISKAI